MNIFKLKKEMDFCGFVSLIRNVETDSAVGNNLLLQQSFATDSQKLQQIFDKTSTAIDVVYNCDSTKRIRALKHLIGEVRDIFRTIETLRCNGVLNDIELFEIKTFAMISEQLRIDFIEILDRMEIDIANVGDVVKKLDPENSGVPTFYIYNAYSERLGELRRELKNNNNLQIDNEIAELEQQIREQLSKELRVFGDSLKENLEAIAILDLFLAKAKFAIDFRLCKPNISDSKTSFVGLFNPEIKEKIEKSGNHYQLIDFEFGKHPTLITGINMGGKTLLLKTLALSQLLCQFGFFVPAQTADIMLVCNVLYSFFDNQDQMSGLSSFASEMKKMDSIIKQISINPLSLVLIDELARTTNPNEGAGFVFSMLEILKKREVPSVLTTHYDVETQNIRRLRVKGLSRSSKTISINSNFDIGKLIDYQLIDDTKTTENHASANDAVAVAKMLGIDCELVENVKKYCNFVEK